MILTANENLDWMLIIGVLNKNTKTYADYEVSSDIYTTDPRNSKRAIKSGTASALIRIYKETGEIDVLFPFPESANPKVLNRISSLIVKNHQKGIYPKDITCACG